MLKYVFGVAFLVYLAMPALAFGQAPPGPGDAVDVADGPAAQWLNIYLACLSAVVPTVVYVLNNKLPFIVTEPIKGLVHAMAAAAVGVLYSAAFGDNFGLTDETLWSVVQSMGIALFAHYGFRAANINVALGGGWNEDGSVSDPKLSTNHPQVRTHRNH